MGNQNAFRLFILFILASVAPLILGGCSTAGVTQKDRLESNLHYAVGASYYKKGDYINALQQFLKARNHDPYSARNYNAMGMVYMVTYRQNKAISSFKKAVSLDKNFSDAYYNLALIYIMDKDYKNAGENLKLALANPFYEKPYQSYTLLAKIYIKEKKFSRAKRILLISRSLNKNYYLTYYYFGKLYLATGKLDKSLKNFKESIDIEGVFLPGEYGRGVAYYKMNRIKKSKAIFEEICKQDNESKYCQKSLKYLGKIKK